MLKPNELKDFLVNGFIGPIKLYDPAEAKEILKNIRIKNQNRSNLIFDNSVNYDRHFDIPELARHICNPKIIEKVNSILGEDLLCWRTEFFPKFPGSQATEWHQVSNYQYANGVPMLESTNALNENQPIDITVWTAFTEATKENGCMKFLPGSHLKKYYDESKPIDRNEEIPYESINSDTGFFGYNFSEFKIDPKWEPDENEAIALEMNAGECVIFTPKCVHASYPNTSTRSTRFAITARYVPTHVKVYPNLSHFYAHGASFDLAKYGCVLVSGNDTYKHNKIRETDNYGYYFKKVFI